MKGSPKRPISTRHFEKPEISRNLAWGTNRHNSHVCNKQNCIFEETSGCMFRHEAAPLCKELDKCKFKKCQFSHSIDVSFEEQCSVSDEEAENEVLDENNEFVHCNELVDHSQHNLQECSNCDFSSKCWAECNKHWQDTSYHIFSTAQLRDMGYNV